MKKLTVLAFAFVLFYGASQAQPLVPADCDNFGILIGDISSQEAQGWDFQSASFQPIYYLVEPEVPYVSGTLTMTYTPDCEPLEPCPKILKASLYDVVITNEDGSCLYKKSVQ